MLRPNSSESLKMKHLKIKNLHIMQNKKKYRVFVLITLGIIPDLNKFKILSKI